LQRYEAEMMDVSPEIAPHTFVTDVGRGYESLARNGNAAKAANDVEQILLDER
jgi:hypothetical protein